MNEMSITINVNCPELVTAINNLANAINGNHPQNSSISVKTTSQTPVTPVVPIQAQNSTHPIAPVQSFSAPVTPITQPPVSVPTAQPSTYAAYPTQIAPTNVPNYTIEQLQTAIAPLLDAGKAGQLQALVQSFGVATLMDIPKDRYGEFANGLRNLGGVL